MPKPPWAPGPPPWIPGPPPFPPGNPPMATVAVVFDGTRISAAESETDGGTWDKWGATQSPSQEGDFVIQGSFSISNKVSNSESGVDFDATTAVDFSTTPRTLIPKVLITTTGLIDLTVARGASYQIGSGPSDYWDYNIFGSVAGAYPVDTSWLIVPIDPNVAAYRDATTGTPSLTAIDYFGWRANITASSKSENVAHDALDYVDNGTGLTLTGGDGVSTDALLLDFVIADEDTITNRWRLASRSKNSDTVFDAVAVWTVGTSGAATVMVDSNRVVKWLGGRVDTGFHGLNLNVENVGSSVDLAACTFISEGVKATNDSRADFNVIGTSGTVNLDGCSFQNFNAFVLTSATSITNTSFINPESMTQAQATLDGCTFDSPTVATNVAFMTAVDLGDISNCDFISSGTGHAIEITATGTYSFVGNQFTGYATDAGTAGDRMIYNNSGGLVTINVSGGGESTISVRNGAGASTVVQNTITLTVQVDDEEGNPVSGARVRIENASTGTQISQGSTNASGTYTDATYNYTSDLAVLTKVRLKGFKNFRTSGTITAAGLTVGVRFATDNIVDLP